MRRNRARAEPPQMHADVSAGRRIWGARAAGGVRTGRLTVLEKDGEILRRVERKVLDPHTGVVHDQPRLAGQPTGKTPPAAAAASNSSNAFRKQAGPPLARTHGSAPLALRVRRLASLRADRGADLGARMWSVRDSLEAHRRARARQVRCDIGG